jgi:hypothetical protein
MAVMTTSSNPFPFYQVKRIFLACPGDLMPERSKFPRLITTVNELRAHSLGIHLEAVGWERVIPSSGHRPQDLINEELKLADLVVVIFWNRLGSPSSTHSERTGTVEEFELARKLHAENGKPLAWVYFKKPTSASGEQLHSVLSLRKDIEEEKNLFFREYESTEEWEVMFQQHLVAYLDGLERWNIDDNVRSMRPELALMKGDFLGEGICKYGTTLRLLADLDGDGNKEEVVFESRHGTFSLNVIKLDKVIPLPLPNWNRISTETFEEPKIVHLAAKDVTNDGLPEILLAVGDGLSYLKLVVYGFNSPEGRKSRILDSSNFSLLHKGGGQQIAHIHEGGTIVLPYGSAGLAWRCAWNGREFRCAD